MKDVAVALAPENVAGPDGALKPAAITPRTPSAVAAARQRPLPMPPVGRPVIPAPVPAYSTSTGSVTGYGTYAVLDDHAGAAIDDVVDKVVVNWWRGASTASREDLLRGKPLVPAEMDRALLSDLSNALAVYDIPQEWRFALREAFWAKVGRL